MLHASADSLAYAAGTLVPLKRHRSAPNDSAAGEKPLPSSVSGVPPSDAPDDGHTDETVAAGRYVNATALAANCWPLAESENRREPDDDDGGEAHSSWPELMRRAAAEIPLPSRRQRKVADSWKPDPSTDSRVPPDTGPAGGTSSLTYNAECTYRLPPLRSAAPCMDSSMLDHPVGSAAGVMQRTPSEP